MKTEPIEKAVNSIETEEELKEALKRQKQLHKKRDKLVRKQDKLSARHDKLVRKIDKVDNNIVAIEDLLEESVVNFEAPKPLAPAAPLKKNAKRSA